MRSFNDDNSRRPTCKLGRFLGSGAYGHVFWAVHVDADGTEREVAVKRALLKESSSLRKERRIFEAFADCPHVIDFYSDDTTITGEGIFYNLLLEYASAGTLQDLIGEFGVSDREVRAYTRMILEALKALHDKSYAHCDLKPENILAFPVGRSYRLKLADFGQAKEPRELILPEMWKGKFRATPQLMSPESVEVGRIGPELDVWSLGCTVVMMATGQCPWKRFEPFDAGEFLRELLPFEDPAIPEEMCEDGKDFLRKCFHRDPTFRWSVHSLLTHRYVNNFF